MKKYPIFDLHCDTLHECRMRGEGLYENNLQLSISRLSQYQRFCQVLAVWSDVKSGEDEAYESFFDAASILSNELSASSDFRLCRSFSDLAKCEADGVGGVFLAVEGGKLLGDDLSRLDTLYEYGVRFLTLVWNDPCKIGGTNKESHGLTDFGREVVEKCLSIGIIPDVSHGSDALIRDTVEICARAGRPCIATHSNSRAVMNHPRNLTDENFMSIVRLGGLVGISLAPMHLTEGTCGVSDIVRHIEHYLFLGGEDAVCLGCDLDGVDVLPEGIESVSDVWKIAEELGRFNYTDRLIEKIFYANARNFISLWLN